jgi:hypothetical protein
VNPVTAVRLAMPVAGVMIAHQVAGKAVRDATFLAAWPVSRLPVMVMATALLVIAAVPVYSRLIERFGPRLVVSVGFLLSAAAHTLEWHFSSAGPWVAVFVYLHLAGLSVLLLSGFWSVLSELFDPGTAKASYGGIAAAGTLGGLAGGLGAGEIARSMPPEFALLMLAALHAGCGAGVVLLRRHGRSAAPGVPEPRGRLFDRGALASAPHLKTLGLIVTLGTAAAALADYLLKMHAVDRIQTNAGLLQFFATFYLVVQLLTFLAQFAVGPAVRRAGLGRTISALPAGVGAMGVLGLLFASFPLFIAVRGIESILRGSFFRSAYELIFVPMAPAEKHRTKTFLDVTCDRVGDACGAGIVQLVLLTGTAYLSTELLGIVIALAAWSLLLASRLDALYLGVVERRLTAHTEGVPIVVGSETGWTVLSLTAIERPANVPAASDTGPLRLPAVDDPVLQRLADLRSGDRARVERSLPRSDRADPLEIVQVMQLLAWDDLVPSARAALERVAPSHVGLLVDALLDRDTDFAIRRRLPRILGTLTGVRALDGLVAGLDDPRFEVRYQCSRAIRRMMARSPSLTVSQPRILDVVERELSVPVQVWQGHRLIDTVERDDDAFEPGHGHEQRNLEHVFSLLSTVLPSEPLAVALTGIVSPDASLRGVAIEYLESVLPPPIWARLWILLELATPSDAGAPGQSGQPPPATPR